ncbi:MAG: hypothetical protein GVY13_12120 [Alphaproteobacteria bacterium]|jgi:hypothetical protein|nr:hypothetical protein [Alphaproteobacteria bacterium]
MGEETVPSGSRTDGLKTSDAAYADLRATDLEAVRRFEAAEQAYAEAPRRLERTV